MTKYLENIFDITNTYDLIISDVFGVVHDGQRLLKNADKFFKQEASKVALLTNDGRGIDDVAEHLKGFNFLKKEHYKDLFTSGFFLDEFYKLNSESNIKCFMLDDYLETSANRKEAVLSVPGITFTSDIKEANYCFASGVCKFDLDYIKNNQDLLSKLTILKNNHCKLLCPNPDKFVVYDNRLIVLAGFIAEQYQKLGGEVISFGKPNKYPYEFIINKYNPNKVLMIGDTLETDIDGANQVGIDSLLIGTGVTKHYWQNNNHGGTFESWLADSTIKPTWYIDEF